MLSDPKAMCPMFSLISIESINLTWLYHLHCNFHIRTKIMCCELSYLSSKLSGSRPLIGTYYYILPYNVSVNPYILFIVQERNNRKNWKSQKWYLEKLTLLNNLTLQMSNSKMSMTEDDSCNSDTVHNQKRKWTQLLQ